VVGVRAGGLSRERRYVGGGEERRTHTKKKKKKKRRRRRRMRGKMGCGEKDSDILCGFSI
jgi:hypothetical protein